MHVFKLIVAIIHIQIIISQVHPRTERNSSEIALGLSEITKATVTNSIAILVPNDTDITNIDDFIKEAHSTDLKTCIFVDLEKYFQYIEDNQIGSVETSSLIFYKPTEIISEIKSRNLAHRLSLFMFFWNAKELSVRKPLYFEEPLRVVIITRPRRNVFRIFYNQAKPDGYGALKIVNWYDASSLGLNKVPLLPSPAVVYTNLEGRVLSIPVIHSPPWNFVEHNNDTVWMNETTDGPLNYSQNLLRVVGGRDFNLLKLLARKMNFKFEFIDPPERTQGAIVTDSMDNITFSGALGILQRREADLLLGDVTVTWERRKAVEFSFFTLADSGAFVTHAPRRLNEALVLVRPFRWEVWPLLVFTIVISGPAFYLIIAIPFWWQRKGLPPIINKSLSNKHRQKHVKCRTYKNLRGKNIPFNYNYIMEMNYGVKDVKNFDRKFNNGTDPLILPDKLLEKCIWFTVTLFLKQSCSELYPGKRAKFLSTILCLATTYVLADVYSAQLTSQLARPAREAPINTLNKLEIAMKYRGYQLYVERQSSSLSTLENGTEIFKRLFNLMEHQGHFRSNNESYLVSSVEEGVSLIMDGSSKVILGGRETLFFNIKRHGIQNFQLSEKLYTRYSAVAVQHGCPFIESLNEVLIHLFEGGILEKMTNEEYEKMFKLSKIAKSEENSNAKNSGEKSTQPVFEAKLKPINLRTLQGAFIVLGIGYFLAGIVLLTEIHRTWLQATYDKFMQVICKWWQKILFFLTVTLVSICQKYQNRLFK